MSNEDLLAGLPGFRDYYPELWVELNHIFTKMRKVAIRYGYDEYEGPSLEKVALIEAKSGENMIKEIFKLTDRDDKNLLLRPEQTPTLARMLAKEQQRYKRPIRWFCIPRLFRDETVQKGRVREFWQLNVDILGEDNVSSDAEIIAVAVDILRECGLKDNQFVVFVNHRELLNTFIKSITNIDPQKIIPIIDKQSSLIQNYVEEDLMKNGSNENESKDLALLFRRIINSSGKFKKQLLLDAERIIPYLDEEDMIRKKVMINEFTNNGLNEKIANDLYKLISIKGKYKNFLTEINQLNLPEISLQAIQELTQVGDYLEAYGVAQPIIFDASLARGLDYYTGIVFEIFDSSGEIVRAICGGGRYADLVSVIGGSPLSGTGFGMGDTALYELLQLKKLLPSSKPTYDIYLAPIKESSIPKLIQLFKILNKDFQVLCNPYPWKVKRHLENADNKNAKLAIFLGPKDIKSNHLSVRRMKDEEQIELENDDKIIENLKAFLK